MPEYRQPNIPTSAHLLLNPLLQPATNQQFPPDRDDIGNIFAMIADPYIALETKNSTIAWLKDYFQSHICVNDNFITTTLGKTRNITLNVPKYEINRLFLHAFFCPTEKWNKVFCEGLKDVINWIENWDTSNNPTYQQLKDSSYRPSLLKQLSLLVKIKSLSEEEEEEEEEERDDKTQDIKKICVHIIEFLYLTSSLNTEIATVHYNFMLKTLVSIATKHEDSFKAILDEPVVTQSQQKTCLELICQWHCFDVSEEDASKLIDLIFKLSVDSWACYNPAEQEQDSRKVKIYHLLGPNSFFSHATPEQMIKFLESLPANVLGTYNDNHENGLFMLLDSSQTGLKKHYSDRLFKLFQKIACDVWAQSPHTGNDKGINSLWLLLCHQNIDFFSEFLKKHSQAVINLLQSIPAHAWAQAPETDNDDEGKNSLWLLLCNADTNYFSTVVNKHSQAVINLLQSMPAHVWTQAPQSGNNEGINSLWLLLDIETHNLFPTLVKNESQAVINLLQTIPDDAWTQAPQSGNAESINSLCLLLCPQNKTSFSTLLSTQPQAMIDILQTIPIDAWDIEPKPGINNLSSLFINHMAALERLASNHAEQIIDLLLRPNSNAWTTNIGTNSLWFLLLREARSLLLSLVEKQPEKMIRLLQKIPTSAWAAKPKTNVSTLNSLSLLLLHHMDSLKNLVNYHPEALISCLNQIPDGTYQARPTEHSTLAAILWKSLTQLMLEDFNQETLINYLNLTSKLDPSSWFLTINEKEMHILTHALTLPGIDELDINQKLLYRILEIEPKKLIEYCKKFKFEYVLNHTQYTYLHKSPTFCLLAGADFSVLSKAIKRLSQYIFSEEAKQSQDVTALINFILSADWKTLFGTLLDSAKAPQKMLSKKLKSLLSSEQIEIATKNSSIPENIKKSLNEEKQPKPKRNSATQDGIPNAKRPSLFNKTKPPKPDRRLSIEDKPSEKRPH